MHDRRHAAWALALAGLLGCSTTVEGVPAEIDGAGVASSPSPAPTAAPTHGPAPEVAKVLIPPASGRCR